MDLTWTGDCFSKYNTCDAGFFRPHSGWVRLIVLIYVPRKSRQVHHHHYQQPLVLVVDPRLPPLPQHYHYPGTASMFRQKIELAPAAAALAAAAPVIHHHHGPMYSPLRVYRASKGSSYHHESPAVDHYESHETATGSGGDFNYGYGDPSESMSYPKIINMGSPGPSGPGPMGHRTRVRSRFVYV
ncbi:hypothetical protein WDU94_001242 [Cyamophila willieti]